MNQSAVIHKKYIEESLRFLKSQPDCEYFAFSAFQLIEGDPCNIKDPVIYNPKNFRKQLPKKRRTKISVIAEFVRELYQ